VVTTAAMRASGDSESAEVEMRSPPATMGRNRLAMVRSEMLSKHFADEEGPNGLHDGLRVIRPALDSELKSVRGEHRRVLKAVKTLGQRGAACPARP